MDRENAKAREREEREREKKAELENINDLPEEVMKTKLMQLELDFVLDTPKFEVLVPHGPKTHLKNICLKILPVVDTLVLCGQEQGCV